MTQAHIMADTESLGEAGVRYSKGSPPPKANAACAFRRSPTARHRLLEGQHAGSDRRDARPGATRDCGLRQARRHDDQHLHQLSDIQAPMRSEHVAFGDTGVVIYSNSVCGARSNFEGGPSALAAGLTGRTPRYGFHLAEQRRATLHVRVDFTPASLNEWGALGGVIGQIAGNYWSVPVIEGIEGAPGSDQLKHFGAAMASFGSTAMFHLVGLTPKQAASPMWPRPRCRASRHAGGCGGVAKILSSTTTVDVVVFLGTAIEPVRVARLVRALRGRRFSVPCSR